MLIHLNKVNESIILIVKFFVKYKMVFFISKKLFPIFILGDHLFFGKQLFFKAAQPEKRDKLNRLPKRKLSQFP